MKFFVILNFLLFTHALNTRKYNITPRNRSLPKDYVKFLNDFQKQKCNENFCDPRYNTNETFVALRAQRFEHRNNLIKQHNRLYQQGKASYSKRLMRWSDWTYEHKLKALCGTRQRFKPRALPLEDVTEPNFLKICQNWPKKPPAELNRCNFPNPIRDQGTCGCCWAFSSVSIVEALIYQCMEKKLELSVQQMVDCDENNQGCDGGWPSLAYYKIALDGISSWKDYVYVTEQQNSCLKSHHKKIVNPHLIYKQMEVELKGDEECLMKIIEKVGPITIAVHADEEFMSYGEGFYANDDCPKTEPNHAMVVCGWGKDPVFGPYWLLRNSWGTEWGENGYVRMKRNNTCGVSTWAMWPAIKGCEYLDIFSTGKERKVFYSTEEEDDVRRRE